MDSIIVFVAKYFFVITIGVVAVYWLMAPRVVKWRLGWQLLGGGLIALALSFLGSHLYFDTRPFVREHIKPLFAHAADNGFPSDHALLTSFIGFTMWFYSRRIAYFLLVVAVLVGTARVAAHIHSPIDIVGSFVFAATAAVLMHYLVRWWDRRSHGSKVKL